MRAAYLPIAAMLVSTLAWPASAQDLQNVEIVVTGSRIDNSDYSDEMPAVGLRRKADFLVQQVTVRGDTRDEGQREEEIRSMVANAIRSAQRSGVELATGEYILTPLTLENAADLVLADDRRPDSERVEFLVKVSLENRSGSEAQAVLKRFIDDVAEVGRAQMDAAGDATLSIVGPDRFRTQIIEQIAQDAKVQAGVLGDDYRVELAGLNMPVQWARSGPVEVLLFIPYELRIVPAP